MSRISKKEALEFAKLCRSNTPEGREAYGRYCRAFRRAYDEGTIGFLERIAEFWPLIKEVNDEIDEMEQNWKGFEKRSKAATKGWEARRRRDAKPQVKRSSSPATISAT